MTLMETATILKHDTTRALKNALKRALRRKVEQPLPSRVPIRRIKRMIREEGLALTDGQPSWFYTAYERGTADPLTNFSLDYIVSSVPKSARVLVTGCGTGITATYLADHGFRQVDGSDLLRECIAVANKIAALGRYENLSFFVADGFNPSLDGQYAVITALHWVFSAWMGNYGNTPVDAEKASAPEYRERLLTELLSKYAPHLAVGGQMLIELTDAVTDYRLASDHQMGEHSRRIYPVRHTPEQVEKCANAVGLMVADKKLCVSYGHHPRTLYILKKA